jgi:lysozyme family protein
MAGGFLPSRTGRFRQTTAASQKLDEHLQQSIADLAPEPPPAVPASSAPPSTGSLGTGKTTMTNAASTALTVKDIMERHVKNMEQIHATQDDAKCDELPAGVDYVVFDGAVNSGVTQSVKWLQRAISNITVDGHIGDETLHAANGVHPEDLISSMCDQRRAFLKTLKNFPKFGKGWMTRVDSVEAFALGNRSHDIEPQERPLGGAKGKIADQVGPAVSPGTATTGTAASATAASIVHEIQTTLAPYSDTLSAIKYVLLAAALGGLAVTIYSTWKANHIRAVS